MSVCCCFQFPLIYIESPLGTRVSQWIDEKGQNGLVQLELQLSDEPTLVSFSCDEIIYEELESILGNYLL